MVYQLPVTGIVFINVPKITQIMMKERIPSRTAVNY